MQANPCAALDQAIQQLQQGVQQLQQGQLQLQQGVQQLQQGQQQLLQGQQQMQQQMQQMQQQIQQQGPQQLGPQTRRQIAEARAMAARALNATQPLRVPLAEVPITTGAKNAMGTVPVNYPVTVFTLQELTRPQLTALLRAYGQPATGTVSVKRQRLADHLGIKY